ncbi:MFS transporter [Bordetella genomosp. 13]|uniref:MFS transporter n=1 Tax=Bordetella genomosp. 13 TaxID=463040 RepID=UPI00164245E7|nr:MFS transporter [Bordetella genomosp. 13]
MTATASAPRSPARPRRTDDTTPAQALAIATASLGSTLVWYNALIYGLFSSALMDAFAPFVSSSEGMGHMAIFFSSTMLVRPLGALVLGLMADRVGRRPALALSFGLTALGTALIVVMPTYDQIGMAAPIGVAAALVLHSFAQGGQIGCSITYVAEQTRTHRGLFASWQLTSQGVTALLAGGMGWSLSPMLSETAMQDWGWRITLAFGIVLALVAWYLHDQCEETPPFRGQEPPARPFIDLFARNGLRLVLACVAVLAATAAGFVAMMLPIMARIDMALPVSYTILSAQVSGLTLLIVGPCMGALSDRVGRVPVMAISAAAMAVLIFPLHQLPAYAGTAGSLLLAQFILALLLAGYLGALPAFLAEMFPTPVRTLGVSLTYSLTAAVFGTLAPILVEVLRQNELPYPPGLYLVVCAACSIFALIIAKRRFDMR